MLIREHCLCAGYALQGKIRFPNPLGPSLGGQFDYIFNVPEFVIQFRRSFGISTSPVHLPRLRPWPGKRPGLVPSLFVLQELTSRSGGYLIA